MIYVERLVNGVTTDRLVGYRTAEGRGDWQWR